MNINDQFSALMKIEETLAKVRKKKSRTKLVLLDTSKTPKGKRP